MRVLIFSTAYAPFIGGAEVAVKEITKRITDIEFVMVTAKLKKDLKSREKIGNIEVYRVGKGNKWDKFRLIFSGWKKAEELGKFNLVWSIMASYAGFAALKYKKKNKKVPFLLTLQEGDSKWHIYNHVWWCWPYFKQIFKKADRIQAISTYLANWARKMGAPGVIEVVPNGVDIEKFQISNSEFRNNFKFQIANLLNIPTEAKLIITVSRLVQKNGVGDLVEAMKFLPDHIHLLVIGTGKLEGELKRRTYRFGLNKRVHFIGLVNHKDLVKYLAISDVFCRPSLSEGLGNVFLEAMAVGLPIIGTRVGGIPDFLKDGETGLFCEVSNPKDIAENIKKIFNDEILRSKLIENAKKLVEEKYSWDLIAKKMENIFESL